MSLNTAAVTEIASEFMISLRLIATVGYSITGTLCMFYFIARLIDIVSYFLKKPMNICQTLFTKHLQQPHVSAAINTSSEGTKL